MCEDTDYLWESMGLENIEEFKCFLGVGVSKNTSMQGESLIHTISKPNEPSIINRTRSAIFPTSIMELRSLLHSINVSRRFLPLTTVTGPLTSLRVCFVYRLTRLLSNVVFPTPGGPTTAMMTGGGSSSGVRFTRGT